MRALWLVAVAVMVGCAGGEPTDGPALPEEYVVGTLGGDGTLRGSIVCDGEDSLVTLTQGDLTAEVVFQHRQVFAVDFEGDTGVAGVAGEMWSGAGFREGWVAFDGTTYGADFLLHCPTAE